MVSLDSCDDLNCNPTCQTRLMPGTRGETDGAMVWTVVFVTLAVILVLLAAGKLFAHDDGGFLARRFLIVAPEDGVLRALTFEARGDEALCWQRRCSIHRGYILSPPFVRKETPRGHPRLRYALCSGAATKSGSRDCLRGVTVAAFPRVAFALAGQGDAICSRNHSLF